MKAIRIHQFGLTEEVLQYEDVPIPDPAANEILIKVEAAALNRADLGLRKGTYRVSPEELPIIPGREFAGVVEKLGSNVREFSIGKRVLAYTGKGGYAEHAAAKISEVCAVPQGVDAATAAAVPTVFLTAWFGLLDEGKLKSGESLLVQAGSSGVGIAAIQIGKHSGATVITTTSDDDKARQLRELGADVIIDYTKTDFAPEVKRATGGRLVSIGGAFGPIPDSPPALPDGRKATRFSITNYLKARPEAFKQLDEILKLVQVKEFRVP